MLLGMVLTVAGVQSIYLGCLAQLFHDYSGAASARWLRMFNYDRSVMGSLALGLAGVLCLVPLLREYISQGYTLPGPIAFQHHLAILGLLFILVGFANFAFTLVLHAAAQAVMQMSRLRKTNSTSSADDVVLLEKAGNNL
jgi:hypothetical protein